MVLIHKTIKKCKKISEIKIFLQVMLLNFLDPITSTAITLGVDLTRIGTCETGIHSSFDIKYFYEIFP